MKLQPLDVTKSSVEEIKDAFFGRRPIIGLVAMLTHNSEHFDEIMASSIFRSEGETLFPECNKIPIGFATNKQVEVYNHGAGIFWNMLKDGYLCLGFGGGPFDDHAPGNEKQCTATLMAKHLGVRNKPSLSFLLDYTLYTDKNGDRLAIDKDASIPEIRFGNIASTLLPGSVVKSIWSCVKHDNTKVEEINKMIEAVMNYINIVQTAQIIFHEDRANTEINPIIIDVNGKERVTFVESDLIDAGKIARHKTKKIWRKNILTIIADPVSKRLVSLNNPKDKKNIEGYVRVIRSCVCKKRGLKTKWEELGKEGCIKQVPELLYIKEHENLLNGSHSHPDVPGLYGDLITKKDIRDAVVYGLGEQFHPKYKNECSKSICKKDCPLYEMGLSQCFKARK
ncbi:MAG TPA: hypothetical protein PK886_00535 [Candidatus Paceibacterota bacterium]|nr:hypothetical protein [Candidatus Paceibacterota bacterium]